MRQFVLPPGVEVDVIRVSQNCDSKSGLGIFWHQKLANQFYGYSTLIEEGVMKLLQGVRIALVVLVVGPQFVNFELANRVVEIGRIIDHAHRFRFGNGRCLKTSVFENSRALCDRHSLGVYSNADNDSAVAQQGVAELSETHFGIMISKPFLDHHLFRVVGPTFNIRVGERELAGLGFRVLLVKILHVVTRDCLVNRSIVKHRSVESA